MKTSLANAFALVNSLSLTNPNISPLTVNVYSWWKFFSPRCATQTGGTTYEIAPQDKGEQGMSNLEAPPREFQPGNSTQERRLRS
jgi:hypothetical protein